MASEKPSTPKDTSDPASASASASQPAPQDGSKTTTTSQCHCGQVTVEIPSPPTSLCECRCTVCYKYGALWAYFPRGQVKVTVAEGVSLRRYVRADAACRDNEEDRTPTIEFCGCPRCGCATHWWGLGKFAGAGQDMGVNCRMLPEKQIEGIERTVEYV
ncbi:hypothetical protein F4778DRAFT_723224 [Xylariomycetidae sp. FL2044]|nr:hypothetical protein F4778DRAFT_723224 [Xylariomycetidae sp. FL2044]